MSYSVEEAVKLLGISEKDLYRAIEEGLLPATFKDGKWFIPPWGIRVFIRTRRIIEKAEGGNLFSSEKLYREILGRLEVILENTESFKAFEVILAKNGELLERIERLEKLLSEKDLEIERLKVFYEKELVKKELEITKTFEEKIDEFKKKIAELEFIISELEKEREILISGKGFVDKYKGEGKSFWERLGKMLTWE